MTAALAAMWLTACGGGGGGGDVAAAPSPAPAPAPGAGGNPPAPAPAAPLGTSFTAATAPTDVWHSLSSSTDGTVMVAGQADLRGAPATSPLFVSQDGGVTFTASTTAPSGIWIASDVSADGNRIAAVQFQANGMWLSLDRGQTFTQVTLPAGVPNNAQFEGVTLSDDGTRVAAVIMGGSIIVGTVAANGTVSWIVPTGLPATASWRSIDSSADGQVMVAVGQDPVAFISTNGGAAWTALTAAAQDWYRVKVSANGQTIAMAGNSFGAGNVAGDGIYVSKDQGATFTRTGVAGDYSGIAMSSDGGVIAATVSNDNAGAGLGSVQLSTDGGTTFAPLPVTIGGVASTETQWRSVAMSGDASRMAVAAGRFDSNTEGQILLTTGSRP